MANKIGLSNKQIKVLVGLMFFFLISLVFVCDKCRSAEPPPMYFQYYNLGQQAAFEDHSVNKLWRQYRHEPNESYEHRIFLEGYLDAGSSLLLRKVEDYNGPSKKFSF